MRKMYPLIVLLLYVSAVYSDSHTLRYYETGVSAPGSGLPEFSFVGYVDDREIVNYNSESGRCRSKVQWMKKVDNGYWERETQIGKQWEAVSKHDVRTVMSRFNQSGDPESVSGTHDLKPGDWVVLKRHVKKKVLFQDLMGHSKFF
ncbi:RT1 class I histocompatibility antigen, AA alpha chain-like [Phyllobates terribilis]|uniref:RT1 class I histocompatibility antigen, AA alpha chain-like n=1 Tax=Phyllobates terribilis TaxID=111132 RepID=UPI003CCA8E50